MLTMRVLGRIEGAKYHSQQGGWVYPTDAKLPQVSFAVGDFLFRVRVSPAAGAGHD